MSESSRKSSIRVTDRRLFTPDGDVREEIEEEIEARERETPEATVKKPTPPEASSERPTPGPEAPGRGAGEAPREAAEEPTLFMALLDNFVVNAYAAMGMVGGPYQQSEPDYRAARQMIDILEMLEKKTKGNLEPAEEKYLRTHLGDLKLAFVRKNKSI
ncbi:MAG: DUF1844 domain-containing protein [Acidobacteria bacterium]|nr:DUF1844 domain-containing protein [Acidobacteriota bacterium]